MAVILMTFLCALSQDIGYTAKTAFIAHNRIGWAMVTDAIAMTINFSGVMAGAANVAINGLSIETVAPVIAYGLGGAMGTGLGMWLSGWLERTFCKPVSHRFREG